MLTVERETSVYEKRLIQECLLLYSKHSISVCDIWLWLFVSQTNTSICLRYLTLTIRIANEYAYLFAISDFDYSYRKQIRVSVCDIWLWLTFGPYPGKYLTPTTSEKHTIMWCSRHQKRPLFTKKDSFRSVCCCTANTPVRKLRERERNSNTSELAWVWSSFTHGVDTETFMWCSRYNERPLFTKKDSFRSVCCCTANTPYLFAISDFDYSYRKRIRVSVCDIWLWLFVSQTNTHICLRYLTLTIRIANKYEYLFAISDFDSHSGLTPANTLPRPHPKNTLSCDAHGTKRDLCLRKKTHSGVFAAVQQTLPCECWEREK
jgi:hypothetical protein